MKYKIGDKFLTKDEHHYFKINKVIYNENRYYSCWYITSIHSEVTDSFKTDRELDGLLKMNKPSNLPGWF